MQVRVRGRLLSDASPEPAAHDVPHVVVDVACARGTGKPDLSAYFGTAPAVLFGVIRAFEVFPSVKAFCLEDCV